MLVLDALWGTKGLGVLRVVKLDRGEEDWSPLSGRVAALEAFGSQLLFPLRVLKVQLSQTCAFCLCFYLLLIMSPLSQALCPGQKGKTNMAVGGACTPTQPIHGHMT